MFINFNLTFNDLKTTISGALNRWTSKIKRPSVEKSLDSVASMKSEK